MTFIFLYIGASLMLVYDVWAAAGWAGGLAAFGASLFAVLAGAWLKPNFNRHNPQLVGATIISLVFLGLAIVLGLNFDAAIMGYHLTGLEWVVAGATLTFMAMPRTRWGAKAPDS